ncbi:MAG: fructose-1,6-bisphosphatase class 1 [Nitrospirales bacterium]|nr:MAG: fructose-1,6-bisphosphatase class 1 [Nitrospirales bacterium]
MIHEPISLTSHILKEDAFPPEATGEFSHIMMNLGIAGKMIARDLRHAGIIDVLGSTGETNIQGEEVQKLDERANEIFIKVFKANEIVKTMVSEEMEKPHLFSDAQRSGKYALYLDPLDGSSNIDVDAPLGSIFSLHRLSEESSGHKEQDLLKAGSEQVGGGYFLYGTNTVFVYTCGKGVHEFTLEPELGEFFLTARNIQMPSRGKIYSVNEGNCQKWSRGMQQYINDIKQTDSATHRPYGLRYTGCLVADVHRILLKGGVYLYPGEMNKPEGKLRLMYEAAPLSFVIEQAGGIGSTGVEPINSIQPKMLHQRVPLVIGSRENVEQVQECMRT